MALHAFRKTTRLKASPDFPVRGLAVRASAKLRFWSVWDYVIAYRTEPAPILIIGELHRQHTPDTPAKMLTSRQKKRFEDS